MVRGREMNHEYSLVVYCLCLLQFLSIVTHLVPIPIQSLRFSPYTKKLLVLAPTHTLFNLFSPYTYTFLFVLVPTVLDGKD